MQHGHLQDLTRLRPYINQVHVVTMIHTRRLATTISHVKGKCFMGVY
jgi:hypothetical protein